MLSILFYRVEDIFEQARMKLRASPFCDADFCSLKQPQVFHLKSSTGELGTSRVGKECK